MFHFYVTDNAASARVRGKQMAEALGGTWGLQECRPATVTVFVKHVPPPRVVAVARQKSRFVVFDPIDNFQWEKMRKASFDGVMASNETHKRKLEQVFPNSWVTTVPHHHCVLSGIRPESSCTDRGGTIGYVGDASNLGISLDELRSRFGEVMAGHNLSLLERIGIGIAYRPNGAARSYKSGIKLANYWAYGIAPVCAPEASYVEMGKDGVNMLVVRSNDELFSALCRLNKDEALRRNLCEQGLLAAREYSIGKVAKLYRALLERIRGI